MTRIYNCNNCRKEIPGSNKKNLSSNEDHLCDECFKVYEIKHTKIYKEAELKALELHKTFKIFKPVTPEVQKDEDVVEPRPDGIKVEVVKESKEGFDKELN